VIVNKDFVSNKPIQTTLIRTENSYLALAKLLLNPYNVLILDEPTNHLDMRSKDVLKNALLHYDGTLILVSHDRDFLQGLTDKVFEFKDGNIKEYIGDIQYYIEKRKIESLQSLEAGQAKAQAIQKEETKPQKLSWEEQKQKDSSRRKLEKQIENQENKIHNLEQEIKELDEKLANTERYQQEIASGELYKQYQACQSALEQAMEEWEKLALMGE
jgi:ATP-binding cassette subfamily F protein 3